MKKLIFSVISIFTLFLFITTLTFAQAIIWSENFTYPDGTIQGSGTPPKWKIDITDCSFDGDDHFEVRSNQMEGNDLDGEAVWTSEDIDISAHSNVKISLDLSETGTLESADYIRIYYIIDGGVETIFDTNGDISGEFSELTASQSNLDGTSLVIKIRVKNNANDENHRFDNIIVQTTQIILDKFLIDSIATQKVGVPFSMTVTAKDASDNTVTNFTGTVNISDLTGTITPTVSGNFSSGVWTGSATIAQEWINDFITVTNSTGSETGSSNTFNVVTGQAPGDVVINELMWMGSSISSADEWIELRNMTDKPIDLSGWQLTRKSSGTEVFMLEIPSGTIPANGYFLISNYNEADSKIAVTPELVDTDVSLVNNQLQIKLYDGQWDTDGILFDTADDGTGAPAAGNNANKYSMMRIGTPGDGAQASSWFTANIAAGWDAGATELGTPGSSNYEYDFGDAPDPLVVTAGQYSTLLANNGARHIITTELYLGSSIDADDDGQQSAGANGDDNDTQGDDEDGVDPVQLNLTIGDNPNIILDVINTTGRQATVTGWIDYDGNGIFGAPESATNTVSSSEPITLIFPPVPITATASTFARFRISTDEASINQPEGDAPDGEVEDYSVTIDTDSDDDGIPDSIEGTGDRDGDGIPDNEDYDPSGWIYDETNGNIIIGGTVSVSPSTGVNIIHDGSNGYYQFTVSTSGDYTLSYTPPSGFILSSSCNAQSTRLDITPTDRNPYDVGKGSKDGSTDKMTNWNCTDNPYYWDFHLQLDDPVIINNNIPLNSQPTNIKLSTFSATVGDNGVVINWTTETEINNAGFNLHRSQQESGQYIKINDAMIPAEGDAATDHSYSYTDRPDQAGTYYYKLEDVAINGQTTFHGPIKVTNVTSVAIDQMVIPDVFELSQNYPNPFNPETEISFVIPKTNYVTVKIYDISGRLVRTLADGMMNAGYHSTIWNGTDSFGDFVGSGVYFCQMESVGFSKTIKLVFAK